MTSLCWLFNFLTKLHHYSLILNFKVRVIIGRNRSHRQFRRCHNFGQNLFTCHLQPMEAWIAIRNGFEICLLRVKDFEGIWPHTCQFRAPKAEYCRIVTKLISWRNFGEISHFTVSLLSRYLLVILISFSWGMPVKSLCKCIEANALNVKKATVTYSFVYVSLARDRFHTLAKRNPCSKLFWTQRGLALE